MSEVKVFEVARRTEGPEFEIDGITFHAIPDAPGMAWLEYVEAVNSGDGVLVGRGIVTWIERCLASDEEVEQWRKLIDPEQRSSPIPLQVLTQVAEWLTEVCTGRPTAPSTPSGDGRSKTGATSTARASSGGSKSGTSVPTASPT